MEKVMNTRLAVVVVVLLLAAAAGSQEAGAAESITYPSKTMISCKVLGNCETKYAGTPDPTRPGAAANRYTRGCSAINRCRG